MQSLRFGRQAKQRGFLRTTEVFVAILDPRLRARGYAFLHFVF